VKRIWREGTGGGGGGRGDGGLERRVTTVVGVVRAVTHDNGKVVWRGSGATALAVGGWWAGSEGVEPSEEQRRSPATSRQ
jgi:hypothetical protein